MDLNKVTQFEFTIGGYFEGYRTINVQLAGDYARVSEDLGHNRTSSQAIPTELTDEAFQRLVTDTWQIVAAWDKEYIEPAIMDGTQWSVALSDADNKTLWQSAGSNAYPKNFEALLFLLRQAKLTKETLGGIDTLLYPQPTSWGLPGDAYHWEAFGDYLAAIDVPTSPTAFFDAFSEFFEKQAGVGLAPGLQTPVAAYYHGGMNGGLVDHDFWLKEGLPLLMNRFMALIAKD